MTSVAESLARVNERIAAACEHSARPIAAVRLVAVSKSKPLAAILRAIECGHRLFGENRVQEALGKIDAIDAGVRWHLVGHLQRNKVKHCVGRFELVHSLDGAELAREMDRRNRTAGVIQAVLVQVNLSAETTKHGVSERDVFPLCDTIAGLPALELRGLMTIPPPVERAEDNRRWFAALRQLRDRLRERSGWELPELSMGMSDDFEVAIEEGATLVRVGTAVFGERG